MKVSPSAAQLRSLTRLDEQFRTSKFGRGNRWSVQWREPDSKRLRERSFATKAAAETYRAELEDDVRSSRYLDPDAGNKPFGEVAEAWYKSKRRVRQSSLDVYRRHLDARILPRWGATPVGQIMKVDVESWIDSLLAGSAPVSLTRAQKALSAASLNQVIATFGSALRFAQAQRLILDSPVEGIELPKPGSKPHGYLTTEEVSLLAASADRDVDRVLLLFLAYTGVRIGEAVALTVADWDAKARRVAITKTADNQSGVWGPTKSGESRSVPVPKAVAEALEVVLNGRSSGPLFPDTQGGQIQVHNWRARSFKRAVEKSGLEVDGLRPHSLRHTFASLAIASGVDVVTLQAVMGHAKPSITLDTYSHLWPKRIDDVAAALDQLLAK